MTSKKNRTGYILIIAGLLLIAAALVLIGKNLLEEKQAGEEAQAVLELLVPEIEKVSGKPIEAAFRGDEAGRIEHEITITQEVPDYVLNPDMDMPVQRLDGNEYVGVLTIPALKLELPVMREWSYPRLKIAPCRYAGNVYQDNMVICAHNYDRHFGRIKTLSPGDSVYFTDVDGNEFEYIVSAKETLKPYSNSEMKNGDWDLTLFTCTVGGATRVTVRCDRIRR